MNFHFLFEELLLVEAIAGRVGKVCICPRHSIAEANRVSPVGLDVNRFRLVGGKVHLNDNVVVFGYGEVNVGVQKVLLSKPAFTFFNIANEPKDR